MIIIIIIIIYGSNNGMNQELYREKYVIKKLK